MIDIEPLASKPWHRGRRGDFTKHAKKPNLTNRDEWDWSLSNCALGKIHGMSPQAVRKTRIKLGKPNYAGGKRAPAPPPALIKSYPLTMHDLRDGPKAHTPMLQRFWKFVDKRSPDECWEWKGCIVFGYGQFGVGSLGVNREQHPAHRVSYVIHHGDIPAGHVVRHKCDNRACVSPFHIELGLQVDNVQDCVKRQQLNQGSKNGNAKFTEDQIREIRKLNQDGYASKDIAKLMNTGESVVWGITKFRTWRNVK